jgi:GT2 family glycosyltransferase
MINISIVVYNQFYSEVASIIRESSKSKCVRNIYIIDNSETYNEELANFKGITYIFNNKNLGYGPGHNIAIKKTIQEGVKYHLVLNPDIYFESDVLGKLSDFMNQNEDVGLLNPLIKYKNGDTQFLCKLLPNPLGLASRLLSPIRKWLEASNNKYELRFTGYNKTMQVASLSGCFMFLRTDVLKKTGSFDERFFMYCEDVDLCRRIGKVSKTMFYPGTSIIHYYSKGSYKNLKLMGFHIYSAFKYFNKWGWFFDKERKRINKETLLQLGYKKQ